MNILPLNFNITYSLYGGGTKTVPYDIWNTPYSQQWLQLWLNVAKTEKLNCWHRQHSIIDKNKLIQECNSLVTSINQQQNLNLPLIEKLDPDRFNHLHHEFELHLANATDKSIWSELNVKIHQIEDIILQSRFESSSYMSIINHTQMVEKLPVEEDWINYQVIPAIWGDLVAGYATTGKNWMETYNTDDRNLIKLNGIKSQEYIMAEFYALYQHDNLKCNDEEVPTHIRDLSTITDFFHWKNSLPEDLKNSVPKYIHQLSLGKFILGRIDIQRLKRFFPEFIPEKFINDKIYRYEWYTYWDENLVSCIDKAIKIECFAKKINTMTNFDPHQFEFTIEQ